MLRQRYSRRELEIDDEAKRRFYWDSAWGWVVRHLTHTRETHKYRRVMCYFVKQGDKASTKIVYQQIVKKYPQTNQAKVARAKLSELK